MACRRHALILSLTLLTLSEIIYLRYNKTNGMIFHNDRYRVVGAGRTSLCRP